MKKLVLASQSPRRKQLLLLANLEFTVSPANIDETVNDNIPVTELVEQLALNKAKAVFAENKDCIVIGADTVVVIDGQILGKPDDEQAAFKMLQLLSGKEHYVYTGVALVSAEKTVVFHEKTSVLFWDLTTEEINTYIKTGEPFGKAGSYAIQGSGALFVKEIHGCYFNVVGLPLAKTVKALKAMY